MTMVFFTHYRIADGEILGWGHSAEPQPIDADHAIALHDEPFDPNPLKEKIAGGVVVLKSAAEQRASRLPKLVEVQQAVFAELRRTDTFMISDYPLTGAERHAWTQYRQMLRDLNGDVAAMINAWTLPPDGVDPIISLRERLQP